MAQPVDPAAYYGSLLDSEKKPSRVMVALLTGIAKYIVGCPIWMGEGGWHRDLKRDVMLLCCCYSC